MKPILMRKKTLYFIILISGLFMMKMLITTEVTIDQRQGSY